MNELKIIKVAELRKKLAVIPGKMLIAALIVFGFGWDTDVNMTVDKLIADSQHTVYQFIIFYGIISYVYFFIKLIGNTLIGVVVAGVVAYLVNSYLGNYDDQTRQLVMYIMLFGGPVLDAVNFLRYIKLKDNVINANYHERDEAYDSGYDRGYDKGYYRGIRDSERLEHERYIEEENRRRLNSRDRRGYSRRREYIEDDYYDDDYSDGYLDDRYGNGRYIDDQYEEDYDDYEDSSDGYIEDNGGFFSDCRDASAIKKRYRDLCKVYHPDSGNGSEDIFMAITEEYNRIMER